MIEAMKQALDALEYFDSEYDVKDEITALRDAIAEASMQRMTDVQQEMEQCPFGYFKAEPFGWTDCAEADEGARPLYERPPLREWVGLTDEEVWEISKNNADDCEYVRAIEAKLKEKNS